MDQLLSDDITHTSTGNRPLVQKKKLTMIVDGFAMFTEMIFFSYAMKDIDTG